MLTLHPVSAGRRVSLSRVFTGLPSQTESVGDVLERLGRSSAERRLFKQIYKLDRSPVFGPGESLEAILTETAAKALGGEPTDLILYGHTMGGQQLSYLPGFADRLRTALGLPGTQILGVSQIACTAVLRSIDLAARYLSTRDRGVPVLILGGDQASIDDSVRLMLGVTVLGDAVIGLTVTSGDGGRYRYLGGASLRDSRFFRSNRMQPEEFRRFATVSCAHMLATAEAAVAVAGMSLSGLRWLMPHHNNALFWHSFSKAADFDSKRIHLDLLPKLGHTFGVDALLALNHADGEGLLEPGDRVLLTSIGQGAYFQAAVVEVMDVP
jgi:3-oxoacyl-[acyl-carrier-protein] synthase-3